MKKNFYKPWLIITSVVGFLSAGYYGYSCADGWWDYSSYSNFAPEAIADESYKPLFYAPYDKFYDSSYMDNATMFNQDIVGQWDDYLNGVMPKKDIEDLLLFSPNSQQTFADFFNQMVKENSEVWDFGNKKLDNFATFLAIAKKVDTYSSDRYDYWDYDQYATAPMQSDLAQDIELYYNNTIKDSDLDAFMKNRMWFQVVKALFYSQDRFAVVDFFNQTSTQQAKNQLYYRALAYVGGAYYQKGDYQNSNLLYAKVFDSCPSLRQMAVYNYRPLTSQELEKTLSLAHENSTKAAILAIDSYYHPHLTSSTLQRIYELDSKSEHLDFVLSRWVNIQEHEILSKQISNFTDQKAYQDHIFESLDNKTLSWINQKAEQPLKLHNPALWYLVSGYFDIFQGNYNKAANNFSLAKDNVKDNELILDQIRIFSLINQVSQIDQLSNQGKQELIPEIDWLLNQLSYYGSLQSGALRFSNAQTYIRDVISRVYNKQGNAVLSEIVKPQVAFYSDLSNTQKMQEFLEKPDLNDWEKVFLKSYYVTLSDIYQNQALLLFYQDKLSESLQVMQKAVTLTKLDYNNKPYSIVYKDFELLGNPFNGKIKDCNDCDHVALQSVKYTKETFLKKLIEMQENIKQDIDVYNNALLVGNAFYNTTYYGNARMFYSSVLLGDNSNFIHDSARKYLLNMDNALKYYNIAFNAATNDEQRAKVTYLMAKIQRNEFYKQSYHNKEYLSSIWADQVAFKAFKGFKELYENYQNTKYYQQVINECGYFKTYVNNKQI
ncbi:hypothetical protein [Myroides sp. LJL110]